ncbi:hypothetical protein PAAG_04199 [Paracoccidioides lutzii Pb01]|uniref:Scramblase family protein n=1 Tax=Paracoccidioides lutzii (strain ATCC MYA-826 / Pb01) TaxID=502779 RepID=C1H0A5_PARBA|nr:hypothetical protein PAAG_04199 [Paracoccidioides lutzii Pb01]EEH33146.1 hypothetical protein PAAG_04199 [Paracoccidioides lutzii Pb01]
MWWRRRLKLPIPRSLLGTRAASLRPSPWSRKGSHLPPLRQKPQNNPGRPDPPLPLPKEDQTRAQSASASSSPGEQNSVSTTLRNTDPQDNSLLAPVHIPEDPNAVLKERHPAAALLANSGLVVQRQLEMMNVLLGFEQANRYTIMDAQGNHVGYMAEQEKGMGGIMARQWFRTHRSFVTHVFDKYENEVLRFHRPFSWINSRIRVYDPLDVASASHSSSKVIQTTPATSLVSTGAGDSARISSLALEDMRVVGETHSQWAPLRRKYNLFLFHPNPTPDTNIQTKHISLSSAELSQSQQLQVAGTLQPSASGEFGQFAYVDEPFLSWDFSLRSADSRLIGSVNRNFSGFARELFTDTGVYALRMDSAALAEEQEKRHIVSQSHRESHPLHDDNDRSGMTLDQRAVMLATAVTIDFDYFSRHSSSGSGLPIPFFGMGGGAAEGAAGDAAGGAVGSAVEGAAAEGAAGAIGRGVAGAGSIAGYEAMQRGMSGDSQQQPYDSQQAMESPPPEQGALQDEEVWGESGQDIWNRDNRSSGTGGGGGNEGGGDDDDDDGDDWGEFF